MFPSTSHGQTILEFAQEGSLGEIVTAVLMDAGRSALTRPSDRRPINFNIHYLGRGDPGWGVILDQAANMDLKAWRNEIHLVPYMVMNTLINLLIAC